MIILGSRLPLSPPVLRDFLWQVALQMRSGGHPWFRGVIERSLSREQVVLGELQHFLRVLRNYMSSMAPFFVEHTRRGILTSYR